MCSCEGRSPDRQAFFAETWAFPTGLRPSPEHNRYCSSMTGVVSPSAWPDLGLGLRQAETDSRASHMKFFVDTADTKEIADLAATGLLDGVTTNPSLVQKSGRKFLE